MDKEHIKGAAQKAKGAVKDAAGRVIGNEKLQAEGKAAAGNVKHAARKAADSLKR